MSQFFQHYGLDILTRASQHLWLSLSAIVGAIFIGIPLGVFIARNQRFQTPVLRLVGIVETVPSLALFGFLLPILGLGTGNALAALLLVSLLPMVRNTFAGLTGVDPSVREAARALGMTRAQILQRVEWPLAADAIIAGIRSATVLCIGVTTTASLVGAGGLGDLILEGLRTGDNALTLAGAIAVTLLALGADWTLKNWSKIVATRRQGAAQITALQRFIMAGAALLFVILLFAPQLLRVLAHA